VAGEGAATGAELDVGHGTVWVNGDIRYIAMQFSRLEAFLGAGLTDSGYSLKLTATIQQQPIKTDIAINIKMSISNA
jgi:hypothetical protein